MAPQGDIHHRHTGGVTWPDHLRVLDPIRSGTNISSLPTEQEEKTQMYCSKCFCLNAKYTQYISFSFLL